MSRRGPRYLINQGNLPGTILKIPLYSRVAPCSLGRRRDAISSICKRSNRISLVYGLFVPLDRGAHITVQCMYTYTHMCVCVCVCTLMSTRARTSVSSPLYSPQLLILVPLFPTLFARILERYRTSAAAFQLTCEYRSTLVMGHSSK